MVLGRRRRLETAGGTAEQAAHLPLRRMASRWRRERAGRQHSGIAEHRRPPSEAEARRRD